MKTKTCPACKYDEITELKEWDFVFEMCVICSDELCAPQLEQMKKDGIEDKPYELVGYKSNNRAATIMAMGK
jgi:hypothetical protein